MAAWEIANTENTTTAEGKKSGVARWRRRGGGSQHLRRTIHRRTSNARRRYEREFSVRCGSSFVPRVVKVVVFVQTCRRLTPTCPSRAGLPRPTNKEEAYMYHQNCKYVCKVVVSTHTHTNAPQSVSDKSRRGKRTQTRELVRVAWLTIPCLWADE